VKFILVAALLPLLFAASCASKSSADKSTASAPPKQKSMNERFGGGGRDPGSYQQDSSGKFYIKDEKRSSFEGKTDANFAGKSFEKQEYKAGDYAKKSWWGNKEYERKAYDGNTNGSRFQTTSRLQGQGAREAGNAANIPDSYQTGTYATGNAREASNAPIQKGTSAAIDNHKDDYAQPEIIDWRQQRALSVDQSKGILGR
jgi:hypothetical protein